MRMGVQTIDKASQNFVRKDETKSESFFAPACTKQKIQIAVQVWNLSAVSRQIMRVATLLCHRHRRGILVDKVRMILSTI